MPESINSKLKEQYDHDDSGGSLDTNLGDFLDSEGASGTSNNSKWRDWASGTGTSLNTRLFHKHGGSGSFMTRWKNWIAFSSTHSFNFDGSNDYLETADNESFDFGTGDFSISFWFNVNDIDWNWAVSRANSANSADLYRAGTNNSGKIIFRDIAGGTDIVGSTTVSINTWYHFQAVRNSGTLKLYLNGSEDASGSSGGNFNSDKGFRVGRWQGSGDYFDGLIDEVAIWDTALSADDVTSIYNNGKVIDLSKSASYGTDRTGNLKLWLRCGDKAEPESTTAIARQDFYTDFDGTNDYVSIGNDSSVQITGALSISSWIKTDNNSKYMFLVNKNDNTNVCYYSEIFNNGQLFFRIVSGGTNYEVGNTANTQIADGNWHHYCCVFEPSTALKIYIDGELKETNTTSIPATIDNDTVDLEIGRRGDNSNYFEGQMSNASVYQTALDAQTISQMAKSRFTPVRNSRFSVVDFDGSNDFIDISSSLTPSALTFTMWVATVADSSYRTFIQCGDLLISKSNGNQVHVNKFGVGGQNSTTSFVANEWTHIAVTADSSATKVYRNGVLDLDGSAIAFTAGDILIGKFTGGQFTSGSISSVAYYSSVKSAEEVLAIYNDGIGGDESSNSNLIGYWKMDNATTVVDNSSNNNNGTVTGATLISAGTTDSVGNNDGGLY